MNSRNLEMGLGYSLNGTGGLILVEPDLPHLGQLHIDDSILAAPSPIGRTLCTNINGVKNGNDTVIAAGHQTGIRFWISE